jgi:hypothetical protein
MNLVMPRFKYSLINDTAIRMEVPAVRDPETGKVETFALPRSFIYKRTTPEAVLGLYEYEYLGEEGQIPASRV